MASKAAATKAPVAEVARTVRSRQGTPAKTTQTRPLHFKVSRGVVVTVRGRLDGTQVVAALRAATLMAEQQLVAESPKADEREQEQEQESAT